MPALVIPLIGGGELVRGKAAGWPMIVAYRRKHCHFCRTYSGTLNGMRLHPPFQNQVHPGVIR